MRPINQHLEYDQDSLKVPDYRVAQYLAQNANKLSATFLNKKLPQAGNALLTSLTVTGTAPAETVRIVAVVKMPCDISHANRTQEQNGLFLSDLVMAAMIDELIPQTVSHFPWKTMFNNNSLQSYLFTQESGGMPGVVVEVKLTK
jgi:hypothetical protein